MRLVLVIMFVVGIAYGAMDVYAKWQTTTPATAYKPWFAAYVDVTSMPTYTFEKQWAVAKSDFILSFIVASPQEPCTPSWGGYYTMSEAESALDLDRRIARLEERGGKVAISFGGANNSELALACTDQKTLFDAYKSVIDHYGVNTIDLDIENQSLKNAGASQRRADVIAQLQKYYRKNGKTLAVWLTLPVSPQGMTEDGTNLITQMLSSRVDVAGVNLMTMDYGASRDPGESMVQASEMALTEAHRQLGILYRQAGINLDSATLWMKMGATPMIGQNDTVNDVFVLDDAVALNQFVNEYGFGRMSMWSANRDIPCGENYVNLKIISDLCSGVSSPAFAFVKALSKDFDGSLVQDASMVTVNNPNANVPVVDNPAISPYPIWQGIAVYLAGTKVVWHGNVYQAKWWTQNDLPDNPVLQPWETPWQLIGPVLPGDKPMAQLKLPNGTFPEWSGNTVYQAGNLVLMNSVPFRAKWWNEGESPAGSAINPDNSPWIPLSQNQVNEIIKQLNTSQ